MRRLMIIMLMIIISIHSAHAQSTFVYCSEGSPSSFNPQIFTDGTSANAATRTIYDQLTRFKYGETNLEPGLAESWSVTKDGLKYIFKLRKNISFHTTSFFKPTRNFNADDVIFSFDRQRIKNHPYHQVSGGTYEYFNAMEMGSVIKEIKKIDDYTVEFILSRADAPFLANLAMGFSSILSKEYSEQLIKENKKEQIDQLPVGTGPFIFKKYVKDNSIRYTANDNYFDGAPKIQNLIFAITPDANVRFQKLKAGECHFITEPSPADLDAIKKLTNFNVISAPGLNVGYLAMNVERAPYNNPKIRQALAHALNRQAYIDAIYLGQAVIAKNPIPPTMWSYNQKIADYDYNIATAKKLLTEAGFANGFETTLWTLPVSRPYNPNGKKMGEMMQADLAKVGIKVKLITFDWPTYLAKSKNGEHQLIQMGWTGDNGDPDNFLAVLLGCSGVEAGSNLSRWCFKPFEGLIQKAKVITDVKARSELYLKSQEIFKQQAPWITLAHSVVYRAMSNKVKGYKIDPLGGDYFHKVELE